MMMNVVWLDDDNKRVFVTFQVKKDLRTTSRPNGGKGEPVARNGKDRNSYNYYDEDIICKFILLFLGKPAFNHRVNHFKS